MKLTHFKSVETLKHIFQSISFYIVVDGQWGEWIPSSACTKCNQTMSRQCNSPAPERGGKGCIGNPSQTQECGVCLGNFTYSYDIVCIHEDSVIYTLH